MKPECFIRKLKVFRTLRPSSQTYDTGGNEKRQTGVDSCLSPKVRPKIQLSNYFIADLKAIEEFISQDGGTRPGLK